MHLRHLPCEAHELASVVRTEGASGAGTGERRATCGTCTGLEGVGCSALGGAAECLADAWG